MPVITGANGIERKGFKKHLVDLPGKPSVDSPQRYIYIYIYSWNMTHANSETVSVRSLKPGRREPPLVEEILVKQEKYKEEKGCDKTHKNNTVKLV